MSFLAFSLISRDARTPCQGEGRGFESRRALQKVLVVGFDVPRVFRTADLWFNLRCDLLFHPFIVDLLRGPVLKS